MAQSSRFRELRTRVTELREHLLPRTFDPTGVYTDRQYDRARAFRVLAHAEIEACLEDLGVETVNVCYGAWQTDRRARRSLMALLAYYEGNLGGPGDRLGAPGTTGPLRDRLKMVRDQYVRQVRVENHGIREKNILSILLPAGILESDLDRTWLATVDSFGAQRGETAHRSGRTQQPPDPAQEVLTVRTIVAGLAPLDAKLVSLRRD
jgi:hypothetical protein